MASRPAIRPFLKWAGGKTQLLAPISRALPERVEGTYYEPFLGSGAVFFHLWSTGRLRGRAVLSDANGPLMDAWRGIRERVEEVIGHLARHREAHARNAERHFYAVRDEEPEDLAARAARIVYLNKTCYNGLWRVNRTGKFNVPLGRYRDPPILDAANLRAVSRALRGVRLLHAPYGKALRSARAGAVVYLDPPYQPLSRTANFTSYTADRFGLEDQVALADACARLRDRGVEFLLSNHDVRVLRGLYAERGFAVEAVPARRAINSDPAARGKIAELLVAPDASRLAGAARAARAAG